MDDANECVDDGPPGWMHWRAALTGKAETSWVECGLYSDATFFGELAPPGFDGPIQVLNGFNTSVFGPAAGTEQPMLFLRIGCYA